MRQPYRCEAVRCMTFGGIWRIDERRTALREATYMRRSRLYHGGKDHAFTDRGRDLAFLNLILPEDPPPWLHHPHLRWGRADEVVGDGFQRTRSPTRAWHVVADLPPTLSRGHWMDEAELLCRLALPHGAVAEIAGHVPLDKPPHVHILIAHRYVTGRTYGEEIPGLQHAIESELQELWLDWLARS